MSKAIAATTQVGYIAEVTENTTPATPAFQIFRATGESLEVNRKHVYSSELNALRGQKNHAIAQKSGAGGLEFEWTDATLEDFLESSLRAAWATDVLINANVPKSFTMETKFEAGTTDVFKRLTGAHINTMALNLRPAEKATGSVSVLSRGAAWANAIVASATYPAGNTEPIMVGADIGALALSGLTFDQIAALTLNINSNLRLQDALNGLEPVGIGAGAFEVTGTLSLFMDSTMFNILTAAQDGTGTGLTFEIGRTAGKKTRFEVPNLILEAPKADAASEQGDVMATFNFRGLQASSLSGGVLRVTRNI